MRQRRALGPGEQCDDGNLVSGDGCDANCTVTACGNGIVTAGRAVRRRQHRRRRRLQPDLRRRRRLRRRHRAAVRALRRRQRRERRRLRRQLHARPRAATASSRRASSATTARTTASISAARSPASASTSTPTASVIGTTSVRTVGNPSQSNVDGDIFGDACDICPGDVNNDSDDDLFCLGTHVQPARGAARIRARARAERAIGSSPRR